MRDGLNSAAAAQSPLIEARRLVASKAQYPIGTRPGGPNAKVEADGAGIIATVAPRTTGYAGDNNGD